MELGKGVSSIVTQLNSVMTLSFLQVITGIREFWDDNSKAEVDTIPVRPSTIADPELMVDLVLSDNDNSSHDQSNQDHDDLYSSEGSQFDGDSEDLSSYAEENCVEKMKSWPQPAMCGQRSRVKMGKPGVLPNNVYFRFAEY